MTKAPRINGRHCRPYVQGRRAFSNSNGQLYAVKHTPLLYVVYSYGEHWPLYVYDGFDWYENEEKASVTTSRHSSYARPYATMSNKRTCKWLKTFIADHLASHRTLTEVQSTLGLAA